MRRRHYPAETVSSSPTAATTTCATPAARRTTSETIPAIAGCPQRAVGERYRRCSEHVGRPRVQPRAHVNPLALLRVTAKLWTPAPPPPSVDAGCDARRVRRFRRGGDRPIPRQCYNLRNGAEGCVERVSKRRQDEHRAGDGGKRLTGRPRRLPRRRRAGGESANVVGGGGEGGGAGRGEHC